MIPPPPFAPNSFIRDDPHAPRYHFVTPYGPNACADPNGAIYWNGRYHLFYIFQDDRLRNGDEFVNKGHCWGHSSSDDLVHWTHHPPALTPSGGGPSGGEVGIFSGCAIVSKEGRPTLIYHGCNAGTCVATALDDDLIRWQKHPANPVIPEPKEEGDPGWGVYNVFDPNVWLEGDTYYAILGGFVKPDDKYDTAYLFESKDLVHWNYVHPFYEPRPEWTISGDDCACPKFFRLGDKHVLLCISHGKGTRLYRGEYRGKRFFPEEHQLMNWPGGACFAPETLLDPRGRRVMWAWVLDQRRDWGTPGSIGVPGVITLPRILSTFPDGSLRVEPAPELTKLRRAPGSLPPFTLAKGRVSLLPEIGGACMELLLEVEALKGRFELMVRASPDRAEETVIACDAKAGELSIDLSRSSLSVDCLRPHPLDYWRGFTPENMTKQTAPFHLSHGEPLSLRVFLDASVIEVYANARLAMTQRVYPSRPDSLGVGIAARGADVKVRRFEYWRMEEANLVSIRS